ncbi:Lipoxygenase [Pyrenophora tritici-repentis]|nr:Lipoxygenase [Pyrenophora tritici-repentis]
MWNQIYFMLCAITSIHGASVHRPDQDISLFTIPNASGNSTRALALAEKRAGWEYGPSIAGDTAFYPTGSIGGPVAKRVADRFSDFQDAVHANVINDSRMAAASIAGGLNVIDDYAILYKGQWKHSAPRGPYSGILANYTDDLLFSMTQLSENPYRIERVPKDAQLPFAVSNAKAVAGETLPSLQNTGRLFLADFLDQAHLRQTAGKYGATCQAYFYIHPVSDDFLPLAVKPNVDGSDLVYTPQDLPNDWLLAKMMFNLNSFWHAQWYHLAATHAVGEIVYLSAIRTLSDEHPIMAILHRLSKDAWAFRVVAAQRLLYSGGPIDKLFPWNGSEAGKYTDTLYQSGEASAFQSNYFEPNLQRRGLIDSTFGPKIKTFPFYRDASAIHAAIRRFMTVFVQSYYPDASDITNDGELQAWVREAGPAKVVDFPPSIENQRALIDVLTHVAHLVSIVHGTLNTNALAASSGSLPFHPFAFYSPLPATKAVHDIMPFLPQVEASVSQIALTADFNRPGFVDSNQTIVHMFDNTTMLARMLPSVQRAEVNFRSTMKRYSMAVRSETFDRDGLCRGMPYCWSTLDPEAAPYSLTV